MAINYRAVFVGLGRLLEDDPNYGLPVRCRVCGATHPASGIAHTEDRKIVTIEPLCEQCFTSDGITERLLNLPKLETTDGGEAATEPFLTLADKPDETEH